MEPFWTGLDQVGFVLFYLVGIGAIGYMPPIENLQNPIDKYASQLISSDGETSRSYARSGDNRIYATYESLSPYLVEALIATEDKRFYAHSGIDFKAILRAIVRTGIYPKATRRWRGHPSPSN